MSWSAHANAQMPFVQQSANASPAEMGQLLTQMNTWAANNNGNHYIPFGRLRNHGVSFKVVGGEIVNVEYGDR